MSCPFCGYPEVGNYKGIYTPGKMCSNCCKVDKRTAEERKFDTIEAARIRLAEKAEDEEMITIPKSQYDDLVIENDLLKRKIEKMMECIMEAAYGDNPYCKDDM